MDEKQGFFKKHFSKQAIKSFFRRQGEVIKAEFAEEPIKTLIKKSLIVILGAFIYAIGCAFFLLRMNIVSGGLTSLAIIFAYIPGLNNLSVNEYIYILNWFFFILGLIILGLKYSLRSLLFIICYPLFISLFEWIIQVAVVDGVHILDIAENIKDITLADGNILYVEDGNGLQTLCYFISALLGGLLIGSGVGFAIFGGGSSGGTDVINLAVHKFFHVRVGTSSLVCDIIIIIGGFFANGFNLIASLVGVFAAILCSLMINKVSMGGNQHYVALIVSNKWHELNTYINEVIERGTTLIKAEGGFSRLDTMLIEVCFDKREYTLIQKVVHKIDPNAFISILSAQEIIGYGFSRNTPEAKDVPISPEISDLIFMKARKNKEKKNDEL